MWAAWLVTVHAVAPVVGRARYAVTVWLSLADRRDALDETGLSSAMSSVDWVGACADYAPLSNGASGRAVPPGTIMANQVLSHAQRDAAEEILRDAQRR